MTTRKTLKITVNNTVILRFEIQGTDTIVDKLVDSYDFKNALEDGTKELIEAVIAKKKEALNEQTVTGK